MVKKFEDAPTGLKVVSSCYTVENAADSAVELISEFLLQVCSFYLFHFCPSLALWLLHWLGRTECFQSIFDVICDLQEFYVLKQEHWSMLVRYLIWSYAVCTLESGDNVGWWVICSNYYVITDAAKTCSNTTRMGIGNIESLWNKHFDCCYRDGALMEM